MICARRGCGHTKKEHDDPLMEGMCAARGCNCLGFAGVGQRPQRLPIEAVPSATKPAPAPAAAPRPASPPPMPGSERTPTVNTPAINRPKGERCPATDDGWQCRLHTHSDGRHRSWSRFGTHVWNDPDRPEQPRPQEATAPVSDEIGGDECGDLLPGDEDLPLAGNVDPEPLDEEREHREAIGRSYADEAAEALAAEQARTETVIAEVAVSLIPVPDERYVLAHEKHADGTKRCPQCEETKAVEDFSPVRLNYDGVHGWCRSCMNARPFAPTLARALRNRARHRAGAALIQGHLDEFEALYEKFHLEAVEEAQLLADVAATDEKAGAIYGEGTGEFVRLKPGRRQKGEQAADRIDVARCPECIRFHDTGHICESCGSAPEHRNVTRTAWSTVQEKLRERSADKRAEA